MFARVKKSGRYQYLQIVENRKVQGKVKQRVLATLGRLDRIEAKGGVETLIRSLARFAQEALLILSGRVDATAQAVKIGPALVFERLWKELEIPTVIRGLLQKRKFAFDVERAVFLVVPVSTSEGVLGSLFPQDAELLRGESGFPFLVTEDELVTRGRRRTGRVFRIHRFAPP